MSHYGGRIAQLSSVRLGGRRRCPRRGRALQLGILGFLLGLGVMGGAWWYSIGPRQTLSLYWLTSADNSIDYVQQERRVRAFDTQEAIRLALEELIAGPRDPHLTTAIPPQTRVLDVRVEGDDIFLNFSPEFTQGGGIHGDDEPDCAGALHGHQPKPRRPGLDLGGRPCPRSAGGRGADPGSTPDTGLVCAQLSAASGAGNPEGLRPPNGVAKASPSDNGFLRRKP